jgi:predicted PolB exonuclease-like 3'-5' exonuclease
MNVLVFDIETVPDIAGGKIIHDLQGLDDESTAKALFHLRKQKTGSDFLPLHLQKIVAISVVYRGMGDDMGHEVSVRSLGDENSSEADLLSLFFKEIEQRTPTIVSWNGTGFDLPVIHYRTLKNKVSAPGYWEKGDNNSAFRYDNYLSRYHERHTDLMDVLASYNHNAAASLQDIAMLLGFPGKMGMDGSLVWDEYQKGNLSGIRNYCETDVLNTYLVYLRYQLMRGELDNDELDAEYTLLKEKLDNSGKEHLLEFSKSWKNI